MCSAVAQEAARLAYLQREARAASELAEREALEKKLMEEAERRKREEEERRR